MLLLPLPGSLAPRALLRCFPLPGSPTSQALGQASPWSTFQTQMRHPLLQEAFPTPEAGEDASPIFPEVPVLASVSRVSHDLSASPCPHWTMHSWRAVAGSYPSLCTQHWCTDWLLNGGGGPQWTSWRDSALSARTRHRRQSGLCEYRPHAGLHVPTPLTPIP